jgi:hypothetical protein
MIHVNRLVYFVLSSQLQMIYNEFERHISSVFEVEMTRYVDKEMNDITASLMGNNLFNLTDAPLTEEIQHWINTGGKYNPHVQKPIHLRLKQFDISFLQCVNKIFKRSHFRGKVILGTSSIHSDLNKFKSTNPASSDLISSIQGSYTSKRL